MPIAAFLLTFAIVFAAGAEDNSHTRLHDLYAQAHRLQEAREFLEETIRGLEDGTKLYIKTQGGGFVVVEKPAVAKSLALAVSSREMTEKKAGQILARLEDDSRRELPRLRRLLVELENEIREKGKEIVSLKNSLERDLKTPEPAAEGKDAGASPSEDAAGQGDTLGKEWLVKESETYGTWTRRKGSSLFDAAWYVEGKIVKGVLYVSMEGRRVEVQRIGGEDGSECTYRGELNDDGVTVEGTYECKGLSSAKPWEAKIVR
jgi:hypothetical protein